MLYKELTANTAKCVIFVTDYTAAIITWVFLHWGHHGWAVLCLLTQIQCIPMLDIEGVAPFLLYQNLRAGVQLCKVSESEEFLFTVKWRNTTITMFVAVSLSARLCVCLVVLVPEHLFGLCYWHFGICGSFQLSLFTQTTSIMRVRACVCVCVGERLVFKKSRRCNLVSGNEFGK